VKRLGRTIPSRLGIAGLEAQVGGLAPVLRRRGAGGEGDLGHEHRFVLAGTCVLLLFAFRAPLVSREGNPV
jgi:hypothetical protein